MDDNQDRVKIRVRVKERIPQEEREGRKKHDTTLWIIVMGMLGICLGYLIADQLMDLLRRPEIEYVPPDQRVIQASEEKMVLELEDLISPTAAPSPGSS